MVREFWISILDIIGARMIEMMVTIGAIRCANHHHQHTNTQLFTERMPSCRQTNSVKALKKKSAEITASHGSATLL